MNAVMDMSERPEDLQAQRRRTSETNSETSNSVASTSEHMDLERANSVPSSRPPPMTLGMVVLLICRKLFSFSTYLS